MSSPKPFVQVACICEKVLIEPDNVVSLIRIVDTMSVGIRAIGPGDLQIEVPKDAPSLGLPMTAFVMLKSGDVIGEHEIGMRLNRPDKGPSPVRKWPVVFSGGEHGANLRIQFTLPSAEPGLYWFDVLWGDEVLTRIPFRLKSTSGESTPDESNAMVPH